MLKLYGFDVSNYHYMLKLSMASKGLEYTFETIYPNQTPEYLKISHMGKVPALETEHGMLTETNIIMEYLDAAYPDKPLYPGDAFQQAKIKELVKLSELYLELPARRCLPEVFFGGKVSDETKKEVKAALIKGIEGLARVAKFTPYLAGDKFSAADIMFLYSMDIAEPVAQKLFDFDLLALAPGAKELLVLLNERDDVKQIAADRKEANVAFKKYIASMQ